MPRACQWPQWAPPVWGAVAGSPGFPDSAVAGVFLLHRYGERASRSVWDGVVWFPRAAGGGGQWGYAGAASGALPLVWSGHPVPSHVGRLLFLSYLSTAQSFKREGSENFQTTLKYVR